MGMAKMTTLLNVKTNAIVTGMTILAGMNAMNAGMKQSISMEKRMVTGTEKRTVTGTEKKATGMEKRVATSTTVMTTADGMMTSAGRNMTVASESSELWLECHDPYQKAKQG